jgi:hypothetical protein
MNKLAKRSLMGREVTSEGLSLLGKLDQPSQESLRVAENTQNTKKSSGSMQIV